MPQLEDPNFKRTVTLLVHNDDEGTFGLVLNRPSDLQMTDLCASLEIDWRGPSESAVHWGGPVQPNTGWVLMDHPARSNPEEEKEVAQGIHFSSSLDALRCVAGEPPVHLRLFLGYAGWAPGQLEDEIGQSAWIVAPVSSDLVFETQPEVMWERVLRNLGIDPATLVASPGIH